MRGMGLTSTGTQGTGTDARPGRGRYAPEPARLDHILVASDLATAAHEAFDHARVLAERFRSHLTLCHLVDAIRYADPCSAQRIAREVDETRGLLESRAAGLWIEHHTVVYRAGAPGRALARHIRAVLPDLTVLATHSPKGVAHLALGHVTETVLRDSGRPVLCVREPAHGSVPYRRIVVPTDLDAHSRRVFPMAALLARAFDAEVVVVCQGRGRYPGLDEAGVHAAVSPAFPGARLTVCITDAKVPLVELSACARADLIVAPAPAPAGPERAAAPRAAELFARTAPCPVLLL